MTPEERECALIARSMAERVSVPEGYRFVLFVVTAGAGAACGTVTQDDMETVGIAAAAAGLPEVGDETEN